MITPSKVLERVFQMERDDPLPKKPERFTWPFRRKHFRESMIKNRGDLSQFLTWPTTVESLFAGATVHSMAEYNSLKSGRMKLAALDPMIGGLCEQRNVATTNFGASGTYIRQATICQLLEGYTGMKAWEWESLFEFGGGYGSLAVVSTRLGFNGIHTILDFPELSLLQEWYLERLNLVGVTNTSWIDTAKDRHYQIFVASCSLDEAPEDFRAKVLREVTARYYLIWYTKKLLPEEDWFENFFMEEFGARPLRIDIPDMNQNQGIIYVDMNTKYGSHKKKNPSRAVRTWAEENELL